MKEQAKLNVLLFSLFPVCDHEIWSPFHFFNWITTFLAKLCFGRWGKTPASFLVQHCCNLCKQFFLLCSSAHCLPLPPHPHWSPGPESAWFPFIVKERMKILVLWVLPLGLFGLDLSVCVFGMVCWRSKFSGLSESENHLGSLLNLLEFSSSFLGILGSGICIFKKPTSNCVCAVDYIVVRAQTTTFDVSLYLRCL